MVIYRVYSQHPLNANRVIVAKCSRNFDHSS